MGDWTVVVTPVTSTTRPIAARIYAALPRCIAPVTHLARPVCVPLIVLRVDWHTGDLEPGNAEGAKRGRCASTGA